MCSGCYGGGSKSEEKGFVSPNLLERTAYNKLLCNIVGSSFFPRSTVIASAKSSAALANSGNLLAELDRNNVSKAVIAPIEPFVTTNYVLSECKKNSSQLIGLMSIDFTEHSVMEIEFQIRSIRRSEHIPGIKFHPNLQKIHPQSDKAHALYSTAEKEGMFILIHGGITPVIYGEERYYSVESNLVPALRNYPSLKTVIAHAGAYFCSNNRFLSQISRLPNVSVDTSGIRPNVILRALEYLGADRVIFGSDWPYGTQKYSLMFVREAVNKYCRDSNNDLEEVYVKVVGGNAGILLS